MATCAVDPIEGRFIACGGMDAKVHIFQINTDTKKEKNDQTIKLISKKHEFSGH